MTQEMSPEALENARRGLGELFGEDEQILEDGEPEQDGIAPIEAEPAAEESEDIRNARGLLERSRKLFERMTLEDREDVIGLHEEIENAIQEDDMARLKQAAEELSEILFFVEER
jgi:hypothetical protein